jgi:hypothetical protein
MLKTLALCAVASLAACSTTRPQAPQTAAVACAEQSAGSHLPLKAGQCTSSPVRSYSQTDIERTGQTDVGSALRLLDPSLTVHH